MMNIINELLQFIYRLFLLTPREPSLRCQVCGKETNELYHWNEMCRNCYDEWCMNYYRAWGLVKDQKRNQS